MKCNEAKDFFLDYWCHELNDAKKLQLESHLAGCVNCREENENLSAVWSNLGRLPAVEPSAALRPRFYAMLEGYQQGLEQATRAPSWHETLESWMGRWMPSRPVFQFALVGLFLIVGLAAGYLLKPSRGNGDGELAQLREEVHDMRQMVTVSLLKQQSASERLKGVSWSNQVMHPDPELLAALVHTFNYDPNVDVRLAAVDALSRFSNDPMVRTNLIQSLQRQNSPLVQIAVIDLLVQLHERQSIDVLKQLTQDAEQNEAVRQRAQWGLQRLS